MASEAILWRRRKFCEVNCASNTCFLAARVPLVTSSSTSVLIDKDVDWKSLKVSGFFQEHLNMQRPPSLTFDANPVILLVLKCDLVFIGYSWGAFKGSSAHMPLYCRLYWLLPLRRLTAVGQSEESRLFRRVSLETLELKQLVLRHTIKLKPSLIKIRIILSYESCKAALVELKNKNKGNEQNRSPLIKS